VHFFVHSSYNFYILNLEKINYTDLVVTMNHIWRELSLIYIACPRKPKIQDLPKLAARHLLDGFPLEMQDGETGILHSKWLTAVFEALTNLIGNTHIFVLSGLVKYPIASVPYNMIHIIWYISYRLYDMFYHMIWFPKVYYSCEMNVNYSCST